MAAIIETRHLTHIYNAGMPDATTALEDVSFAVEEGDFVGIIGATGSGKSTLIGHMNGLNKPTGGRIIIDGRDVWEDPAKIRDFRFLTGLVFQYPEYQLFEETCYKDIAFGPKNMGLTDQEAETRAREAAHFTGLKEELLEKSPFDLSGGQKRRVAIAGVIAMEPAVLVLDEPTAGLDPVVRDEILDEFLNFICDEDHAILISSHITSDLEKIADYIVFLHEGKVVFSKPKDELVEQYGIIKCGAAQFDALDKSDLIVYRKTDYEWQALVADRDKMQKKYPNALVVPASIDEIMLLYVKGEAA